MLFLFVVSSYCSLNAESLPFASTKNKRHIRLPTFPLSCCHTAASPLLTWAS